MITNSIFEQAKDLHVRNYVVYGKADDNCLYYDAEYTKPVTQADLEDAFIKGALLINNSSVLLVPIALSENTVTTFVDSETESFETWSALAAE